MTEAEFRVRVKDYVASIPVAKPVRLFAWSARLLTPFVTNEGQITRECFGTVKARTWQEAGAKIALYRLGLVPEKWFTDVIVRQGLGAAMAWDRHGPLSALDGPDLVRHDQEEDLCPASSAE